MDACAADGHAQAGAAGVPGDGARLLQAAVGRNVHRAGHRERAQAEAEAVQAAAQAAGGDVQVGCVLLLLAFTVLGLQLLASSTPSATAGATWM